MPYYSPSRHIAPSPMLHRLSSQIFGSCAILAMSQLVFTTMSLETYDLALSHFVWIRGARRRQKANRRSHLGAFNPHLTGPAAETFGTSLSTFVYWCVFICVFLFIYFHLCISTFRWVGIFLDQHFPRTKITNCLQHQLMFYFFPLEA